MVVHQQSIETIAFNGVRIVDYTAGRNTSSSLAVITVPPGMGHRKAWSRRSDKYYYVTSGRVCFFIDGARFELMQGDLCVIHQGQVCAYQNQAAEPATLVLVHTPSFDLTAEVFVED